MWKFMMVAMIYSTQFPPHQEFSNSTWVGTEKACKELMAKHTTSREYEKLGVKYRLEVKTDCQADRVDPATAAKIEQAQMDQRGERTAAAPTPQVRQAPVGQRRDNALPPPLPGQDGVRDHRIYRPDNGVFPGGGFFR